MSYNNQEIFNLVANHLHSQGEQSKVGFVCAYRGTYGLKCAIGALIPDSLYSRDMDSIVNTSVRNIIEKFPVIEKLFENCNTDLLSDLQQAHDSIDNCIADTQKFNLEKVKINLQGIATKYKLEFNAR